MESIEWYNFTGNTIVFSSLFLIVVFSLVYILMTYTRHVLRFLGLDIHVWKYRNPADRTCIHCGQTQNDYCWGMENFNSHGWWEDMNEVDNPCGGKIDE